jgi:hypothetical protein
MEQPLCSYLTPDPDASLQVVTDYEAEMMDLRDTMEEFFQSEVLPAISLHLPKNPCRVAFLVPRLPLLRTFNPLPQRKIHSS